MTIRILLVFSLLANAVFLQAQSTIKGSVKDAEDNHPIKDAAIIVVGTGKVGATDKDGNFKIEGVNCVRCTLSVTHDGYTPVAVESVDNAMFATPVQVVLKKITVTDDKPSELPTVTLDEAESETEGAGEVANLLHASRDVFQAVSGYAWSTFRFRERGYDSSLFPVYLNGSPVNDPESGITFFGEFGGLNDVLRNRSSSVGLDPAEFAFSDMGGATMIDTRASVQRKQIRASYAVSNRIYRNRVMLTASTGLMPGGWAVSVSGSRRWAQEGYVPGTFFDGYSYFLSVDKKVGKKHNLNLTFLGAPAVRGRSADSFQEMFDIAGTNYYNPMWGYQNGDKRNASVSKTNQPIGILRWDWNPSEKTSLIVSAMGQAGRSGVTRLNFNDGRNPNPDYNRRLPSSLEDSTLISLQTELMRTDETYRQIDWFSLYEANRHNQESVANADGVIGQTKEGNRSVYIIEESRTDSKEASLNLILNHTINTRLKLNGGALYQYYVGRNFKVMNDLLGGDYWVDWDFFGNFDSQIDPNLRNNDLGTLNNIIEVGDIFGFNYDENIRNANAWAQLNYTGRKFQFFAAGTGGQNSFWRTGYMQNGRFPNNSLGDSEKYNFTTYALKGGGTWKLNGRNYLYANGYYGTHAPSMRNSFVSPRTRDVVIDGLEVANAQSIEGGYLLRSPNFKARVTGFFTKFGNETENTFTSAWSIGRVLSELDLGSLNLGNNDVFLEQPVFLGSAILRGVDRQHAGLEAAFEYKPFVSWTFTGASSLGKYIYTSRPQLYLALDNADIPAIDAGVVYQKNFYVPRTPQTTASVGVKYEGKKFWFASLSLNYADNMWYDFDRVRRTSRFVSGLTPDMPIWNTIIDQQKAPAAYTLDFFGGKSWKLRDKYFLYLNAGVNNILNNQNIITSGRDSYRNAFRNEVSDPRFYTNELLYAPGANYFISLTIRK